MDVKELTAQMQFAGKAKALAQRIVDLAEAAGIEAPKRRKRRKKATEGAESAKKPRKAKKAKKPGPRDASEEGEE